MRKFWFCLFFQFLSAVVLPMLALADCDGALVRATYSSMSSDHIDYRLASFVSEASYNEVKQNAGANAVLYGVPMGGSWGDYQENVRNVTRSMSTSLTQDQARNVLWTGLDPNAAGAYKECIDRTLSAGGLHMEVKQATKDDVTILISWIPVGRANTEAYPTWKPNMPELGELPKRLDPGQTILVLHRPGKALQIVANFDGRAASLVLTPFPLPLSVCDSYAIAPKKPACFQNDANRPGLAPNPRRMTVAMTNTCKEPYEYKIWSGQEPSHAIWTSTSGVLQPGEHKDVVDENSDARIRVYAKPIACQKMTFPVPDTPGFATNWD